MFYGSCEWWVWWEPIISAWPGCAHAQISKQHKSEDWSANVQIVIPTGQLHKSENENVWSGHLGNPVTELWNTSSGLILRWILYQLCAKGCTCPTLRKPNQFLQLPGTPVPNLPLGRLLNGSLLTVSAQCHQPRQVKFCVNPISSMMVSAQFHV